MRESKQPSVVISVRLPPDLHQTITEMATREDRSLSGQIVRLLKQALADVPRPS